MSREPAHRGPSIERSGSLHQHGEFYGNLIRTIHFNVHAPLLPRLPANDAQEDCAVRVLGVTL